MLIGNGLVEGWNDGNVILVHDPLVFLILRLDLGSTIERVENSLAELFFDILDISVISEREVLYTVREIYGIYSCSLENLVEDIAVGVRGDVEISGDLVDVDEPLDETTFMVCESLVDSVEVGTVGVTVSVVSVISVSSLQCIKGLKYFLVTIDSDFFQITLKINVVRSHDILGVQGENIAGESGEFNFEVHSNFVGGMPDINVHL